MNAQWSMESSQEISVIRCYGTEYFRKIQEHHAGSSHPAVKIGKRREGFPSWFWVGWNASVSNMLRYSEMRAPTQSLVRNVEITCYSQQNVASQSLIIKDMSVTEDRKGPTGQHIRINLKTAKFDPNAPSSNTLEFDAERIEWKYFTVEGITKNSTIKNTTALGPNFVFGLPGRSSSSECGLLSIAPDEEIRKEVFNQSVQAAPETSSNWSLVRLYKLRLELSTSSWLVGEFRHLLNDSRLEAPVLNLIDDGFKFVKCGKTSELPSRMMYCTGQGYSEEEVASDRAKGLRMRLQQSDPLFVLLIRRHGPYWERVGSGLMFEEDWPSSSKHAEIRVYQERIVLV
jgi:hypothetical protein